MDAVGRLVFSPDGRTLVSTPETEGGLKDRMVRLWDVTPRGDAPGRPLRSLANLGLWPNPAFSPDGSLVAVSNWSGPGLTFRVDGGVHVWEAATGKERFRGADDLGAYCAAFSADGRLLAAAGADGDNRVVVWETATWHKVGTFRGHHGGALALAFSPDHRTLATGGVDSTILLWDLTGGSDGGRRRAGLRTAAEREAAWAALRGNAAAAYRAVWALAEDPRRAVPLLAGRLRPVPPPDARAVARLAADLDAADFATRDKAAAALAEMGEPAAPALRELLKGELAPEARRTLSRLLESWEAAPASLRQLRAVQALEYAATPDARRALAELARGPADARLTREARAALRRLDARPR
jgi:hypothetical protein